jgi:uncharacterized protein YjbI with pentapeptide repeats
VTCHYIKNGNDKWCEKFPIVLTDEDGRDYCAFHAPQGRKGLTLHEFNATVFNHINEAKREGKACYIGGAIFEGDIDSPGFNKDSPLPSLHFSEVVFPGKVSFSNAYYKDSLMFIKTKFQKEAHFINTKIKGVFFLGAVEFQKNAVFISTEFLGPTEFMGVKFSSMANFLSANFNGRDVSFRGCEFEDYARFEISKFTGKTRIQQSQFKQKANFENCKFKGEVLLEENKFAKIVSFKDAAFYSKTSIIKTIFEEKADFGNVLFSRNSFIKGETFHDVGILTNLSIQGKLILDGVSLKKTTLLDSDLRKIDFYNCEWYEQNGWKLLYDEVLATTTNDNSNTSQLMGKLEILYRQLKQKYKEENNEIEASNWHYREKEIQRKSASSLFIKIFLNIYYIASGYGENPRLALLVLISLILFSTFVLSIVGLIPINNVTQLCSASAVKWPENADFRQMIFVLNDVFKYVTFQKDACLQPTSIIGQIVKILTQILIPIQSALFAFALKNKFRR